MRKIKKEEVKRVDKDIIRGRKKKKLKENIMRQIIWR